MKVAVITGSGRKGGLGFETAKQLGKQGYHVILAARKDKKQMQALVDQLQAENISASFVIVDITDEKNASDIAAYLLKEYGKIDVLINNAAYMRAGGTIEDQSIREVKEVLDTNVIGTWNITQKFLPLLKKSEHPRIVNGSSGAGSFGDPQYGFLYGTLGIPASGYGISKLAVNGLTLKMAKELAQDNILVNAVCPDITDTFGSGEFGRPVEISAKSVVWAAVLPDHGPTGKFFRDGKEIPW